MKCLNRCLALFLCIIMILNVPNTVFAVNSSTGSEDVQIYSVPIISNEYDGSHITFYGIEGKYYLSFDDIKELARFELEETDTTIALTQGLRELVIEKSSGHLVDCDFVDQGNIDIIQYDGKYLCEGIPMLMYLGAACALKENQVLEVMMPTITIWESIMPDYLDYYFNITELYGGEDNVKISLACDIIADVLDGVSGHGLFANGDTHLEDALYEILNVDMMKYESVQEIASVQNQKINDFLSSAVFGTMLDTGDNMYDAVYEALDYYSKFYVSAKNDILLDMMTQTDDLDYASELASQIKEQVYAQSATKANLKNAKKAQSFMDIGMLAFDTAITSYSMMQYNDDTKNLFARTINQEMFEYANYYDISWNNVSDKISNTLKSTQSIVANTAIDNVAEFAVEKVTEEGSKTALSAFTSKANIYTAAIQIGSFIASLINYESNQAFSADMNAIWLSTVQYDIAQLTSRMLVKERDEYHFSDTESLKKLKDMFTLYYRTIIAFSENMAVSVDEFGGKNKNEWVQYFGGTSGKSVSNDAAIYLYRITNCTIVPIVEYSDLSDDLLVTEWISQFKVKDTQSINLLDGYWENTIQSHNVYQFLEDGTVKEYNAEPGVPAVPENLFYSRTLQYQWDGKTLIIDWGEGFKAALELVTKASPIEWDNGLSNQISKIPDDEEFFYETGWEYSGAPSDNALYLVKVDAAEAIQESNELYDNDILTVTGTLKEQNYEINSENYGVAYILELDAPIKKSLYSDLLGYSGETVEISEIQIQFSLTDEYIQDNLVGKHLTVSGTVMYGHTGHHLTTVLLTYATVLNS